MSAGSLSQPGPCITYTVQYNLSSFFIFLFLLSFLSRSLAYFLFLPPCLFKLFSRLSFPSYDLSSSVFRFLFFFFFCYFFLPPPSHLLLIIYFLFLSSPPPTPPPPQKKVLSFSLPSLLAFNFFIIPFIVFYPFLSYLISRIYLSNLFSLTLPLFSSVLMDLIFFMNVFILSTKHK